MLDYLRLPSARWQFGNNYNHCCSAVYMVTEETFTTIVFLSSKGHGIDDMFFSME